MQTPKVRSLGRWWVNKGLGNEDRGIRITGTGIQEELIRGAGGQASGSAFWRELNDRGNAVALIDGSNGTRLTYRALTEKLKAGARRLGDTKKKLVLIVLGNDIGGLLCYLTALWAGHAICICRALRANKFNVDLVAAYQPDIVLCKGPIGALLHTAMYGGQEALFGYSVMVRRTQGIELSQDLALLLSTSGTTGSPKMVCLSAQGVASASDQVRRALDIDSRDRGVTSLPMAYIYGLSVVHSHLAAGASVVVTDCTIMERQFWRTLAETEVTALPTVSWTCQRMQEIGFGTLILPHLRKITHSGSTLDAQTRDWLIEVARARSIRLYFMYGQTEAGGRISVLPPNLVELKRGSVGRPVHGGTVICDGAGELLYRGSNVMCGYANDRASLSSVRESPQVLRTGDLGHIDSDGCIFLTGRLSRICKIFGLRISLDDIEAFLSSSGSVAVVSDEHNILVFHEGGITTALSSRLSELALELKIPAHLFAFRQVLSLPRTESGKVVYKDLICGEIDGGR